MLTTITIIIILLILYYMRETMKNILTVQRLQHDINKDLKNNIEVLDKRTAEIIKIVNKYLENENEIYELISNFGKEE